MTDYIKRDMTGERFGRLVVLEKAGVHTSPCGTKRSMWKCMCDCGKIITASRNNLIGGKIVSCGCYKVERLNKHNEKHCGTHDRLYQVWKGMKSRCYNKKNKNYKYYGELGVKVCDEWKEDYGAFREWAYANGYDENAKPMDCTIDRIDPNGNYEPKNCRWVDMYVQNKDSHKRKAV